MFLKCFLIFAQFQPHVSYRHVSYKKACTGQIGFKTDSKFRNTKKHLCWKASRMSCLKFSPVKTGALVKP